MISYNWLLEYKKSGLKYLYYKIKSYFDGLEPPTIQTKFLHTTNVAILYVTKSRRKLWCCTKFLECTLMLFLYHYKLLCWFCCSICIPYEWFVALDMSFFVGYMPTVWVSLRLSSALPLLRLRLRRFGNFDPATLSIPCMWQHRWCY